MVKFWGLDAQPWWFICEKKRLLPNLLNEEKEREHKCE